MYDYWLYKRGFSTPLLKYVDLEKWNYILQEIQEGTYDNCARGQSLAYKALRQGYFWPKIDALDFARKCNKCQRFSYTPRSHPEKLTSITSPWPFTIWGIDLIGPMPTACRAFKYAVVAVDYFTKWAEAKPLATISSKKVYELFWESIIYSFVTPQRLPQIMVRSSTVMSFVHFTMISGSRKASLQVIIPSLTAK